MNISPSPASASRLIDTLTGTLIAASIIVSLVPFSPTFGSTPASPTYVDGSFLRQAQLLPLFAIAAYVLCHQKHVTVDRLRHLNPFFVLLLIYCSLSSLWSAFPVTTLKRVVILIGFSLIGLAISIRPGAFERLLRVMRWTLTIVCLFSAVMAISNPAIGVDYTLDGAWRGITWHKNTLGGAASYAVLLWFRQLVVGDTHRALSFVALFFCLSVLILSKSSTAVLVTGLGLAAYVVLHRQWLRGKHFGLIVALLGLTALGLCLHLFFLATGRFPTWHDLAAPIAALFNKDVDLTGRTDIWRLTMLSVQQHPILGTGYAAFWLGLGSPSQYIIDSLGWLPHHAHNGYLDALNELGIVGSLIVLSVFSWHSRSIIRLFRYERETAALQGVFFLILLTTNFSETTLLNSTSFQNILFIYCCVMLPYQLASARARHSVHLTAQPLIPQTTRF